MRNTTALRDGLREQGRVFYALLLREIQTRFGKHRIGYAWALLEPALHISILFAMRSIMGAVTPAHVPLLLWLISGIIPFFMFRSIATKVAGAARGNSDLLILPPVRLMDIIWARTVMELATYCSILVFFFGLYAAVVEPPNIHDPLRLLGEMVLLALLGLGFGMVALVVTAVFPSTQTLLSGVLRVLYFTSGVLFSINRIPPDLQPYLYWNPLLHVFERLHAAMFISYTPLPQASDLGYALGWGLGLLLFGILLVKRFMRTILEAA